MAFLSVDNKNNHTETLLSNVKFHTSHYLSLIGLWPQANGPMSPSYSCPINSKLKEAVEVLTDFHPGPEL